MLLGGKMAVPPLMAACAPLFWSSQNTGFGTSRNSKTADSDGKSNNIILLGRFLRSFQNFWQSAVVHKSDAIILLINTPLRMCR